MRYLKIFLLLVAVVLTTALVMEAQLPRSKSSSLTVSFSAAQSRYLGLDPAEVYNAIMRDLKPKHLRLQANWNEIEPKPGEFDFRELDGYVAQAARAGASVTLAIGRKLPRWPECHDPGWLANLKPWESDERLELMIRQVVEHYRTNPTIIRWQVENEPLFAFGGCPAPNLHRLRREVALVKSLDPTHPILITDSGELSPWWEAASLADELGVTLYQMTWNPVTGYFSYPLAPRFYRAKAALVAPFVKQIIVSELQMEPWAPHGLVGLSLTEAKQSFDLDRFWYNVNFFRSLGLPEGVVWGVEWWYAAKQAGDGSFWKAGQELFGETQRG